MDSSEGNIVSTSLITPLIPTQERNILSIVLLSIIIIIIICFTIYWATLALLYIYPSLLKKILFENFRMLFVNAAIFLKL